MVDVNIVNFITIGLMSILGIALIKWLAGFVGIDLARWI